MTIVTEGEPGSINLAEQTLVQEDKEEGTKLSHRLSGSANYDVAEDEKRGNFKVADTLLEEEEDIVDVKGQPLNFHHGDDQLTSEDSATGLNKRSRRTSHLRLELSTKESATPWERLTSPPNGHLKAVNGYYTPTDSQRNIDAQRRFIPKSSYYFGPPGPDSAYGTAPVGQIGVHHPREILRVERDYTGGELIQFTAIYPIELEGRITPTQFLESINAINELLISAHSLRHTFFDNALAVFSLQVSRVIKTTHFEKEMKRLEELIVQLNRELYNPVGLNILWPRNVAFLFLEIEYY
jgi:hypothetical protein